MLLHDLVPMDELAATISNGYVKVSDHPTAPLSILNYTQKAQFDNHWTPVTKRCRGLIVTRDAQIVARPFEKFFNHGQVEVPTHGPIVAMDKADGSLGILYHDGEDWAIATRGSFTSEQAVHATEVLRRRYRFEPTPGWTYLFEIIYPENRVVVDYGGLDDLVLLGAIEIATGDHVDLDVAANTWPGPVVETLSFASFTEALLAPPRPNREGMVIRFLNGGHMLKVKQDDYVRLHRLIFGVSGKTIYEALRSPDSAAAFEAMLDRVPDEFYKWVTAVRDDLLRERHAVEAAACALYDAVSDAVLVSPDDPGYQKAFALKLQEMHDGPLRSPVFAMRSGKTFDYWKLIEPPKTTPTTRSEDND